ncbi:radial spoke head protein 9 homolog isoform X1 [Canis lupus familiaris]|uniref:radial spoke head protein 9 homolog isoform X1 n=1 Tax=Canis lupus familiaris TaxID=9615 RepID=UPI0018F510CA|nr:radial spoke head protein 9 homolog isoform X1 [Canis lupus familiaris]
MDSESLLLSLELASGSGQGLSPDRRASLLTSLTLVKRDYRYSRVLFWGRILGLVADYYIAQGLSEDQLAPRKTLYRQGHERRRSKARVPGERGPVAARWTPDIPKTAVSRRVRSLGGLNCMEWSLLPPATEEMAVETSVVKGRFMGDPSHEYEHTELQKMKEGEKVFEEEVVVQIKEENRLVSVINQIDKAVAVIPRGALFKTPFGPIHVNRTFEGLSLSEAKKLSSYFHFREPVELKNKTLLEKADLDPSLDFMDSLEHDIPKATLQGGYCYHPHFTGSWSIQMERGNALVVLRSLLWPGLTFFHAPRTKNYGYIYMGTGEKNIDLPFML